MKRAFVLAAMTCCLWTLGFPVFCSALRAPRSALLLAHPVPREVHDRVIVVRLTAEAVVVEYHLEVDAWTVVYKDVPALVEGDQLAKFQTPRDWYDAFARNYAPILAGNLSARLDDKELQFTCVKQTHKDQDSIWCDFVFRAAWKPALGEPHRIAFREGNYQLESGRLKLSLTADGTINLLTKDEPDEALKARPLTELRPGDDKRLRTAGATFRLRPTPAISPSPTAPETIAAGPSASEVAAPASPHSLLELMLDTQRGFWMLMLLAGWLGAVHALTPGHGKTLVAAYLVGERGTAWHALLLGIVTTVTHTGAVLVLSAALLLFPQTSLGDVQIVLGFGGGLLIAGLGLWLLLRRLAGQADHVHLGAHGHHHHHGHDHPHDHGGADHYHDERGHVHPAPTAQPVGTWALLVLGFQGGMLPCTDAIALFGYMVFTQRIWLALPVLLAFSAGLAAVLVAIGVAVVYAKGFAGSRWSESRLFNALPVISAAVVTALGLWLCYDSLHAMPHG